MLKKSLAITLVAALHVTPPALAQSQAETIEIQTKLAKFKGSNFSCTKSRRALRRLTKEHPAYTFAFAGRKAPTITGIRGCGFAWNTNPDKARSVAMQNCKKWEIQYGTGGGKWTCRLMR